jgi:hypothetical protein
MTSRQPNSRTFCRSGSIAAGSLELGQITEVRKFLAFVQTLRGQLAAAELISTYRVAILVGDSVFYT